MLSAALDLASGYASMVNELGAVATLTNASGDVDITLFTTPLQKDDQHLVNSYGADARVGSTLIDPLVEKFDEIVLTDGTRYTVQAVHPVRVLDAMIGQRLYLTTSAP